MKRIKIKELPKILTEDIIIILAKMSDEIPQSREWYEIFEILSTSDYRKVMDKKSELQRQKENQEEITEHSTAQEATKRERIKKDSDPHKFYGNMGQPDTPQEYKNRYGVWPPGYSPLKIEIDHVFSKEEYDYYPRFLDNQEVVIRVLANGSISDNVSSIEVYKNNNWIKNNRILESFMNHYITGWITDEDKIDIEIVKEHLISGMTCRTIKARNIAFEKHKDQRYGIYPYEVHLTNVVNVLLHFGFNIKDDELIVSAWLHDIIEDTDFDKSLLTTYFGENIRSVIEAVSNHKDSTKTKLENKRITFIKISGNEKAIIVKLADRIANVEFSLLHGSLDKLKKYKEEQFLLDELIQPKINTEKATKMFSYLKEMIDPQLA